MPLPLLVGAAAIGGFLISSRSAINNVKEESFNRGYRAGYEDASAKYEKKFRMQIEAFTKDKNKAKKERDEYRKLCEELYEELVKYKIKASEDSSYCNLRDRVQRDYNAVKKAA